jgi:hypothetical protein
MCIGQDVKAQHPHDTQGAPGDVPGATGRPAARGRPPAAAAAHFKMLTPRTGGGPEKQGPKVPPEEWLVPQGIGRCYPDIVAGC